MDNSHYEWLNQKAAAEAEAEAGGGAEMNNNKVDVDLTLKLGLPDYNQALYDQFAATSSLAPNHVADLNFAVPDTQGMNPLEMLNQEAAIMADQGPQQRLNSSQYYAWPPSDQTIASNVQNMNYANGFNQFSGPSMGFPSYSTNINSYNNFVPNNTHHHHHQQLPAAPSPLPTTNNYTLLDVPPMRAANFELGSSSASGSGRRGSNRRQRGGNYNDPNKRCTNYNCNTNNTPMWRRGPLGPKTLCNACGIKYRKEEEKRRAKDQT